VMNAHYYHHLSVCVICNSNLRLVASSRPQNMQPFELFKWNSLSLAFELVDAVDFYEF